MMYTYVFETMVKIEIAVQALIIFEYLKYKT